MSSRCQKCGVDLHPGLCGVCAREEAAASAKKRSSGERERARHILKRFHGIVQAIEYTIDDENTPPGYDSGEAITRTAVELAVVLAKLDAYMRTEQPEAGTATPRNKEP